MNKKQQQSKPVFRLFMKLFTRINVFVYRASHGRLMNRAFGSPICLVTMTGITAGGLTRRMRARRASDDEKAALWPVAVAVYADFEQYQKRTERNIPMLICSPV
jgi:hypothetical protein